MYESHLGLQAWGWRIGYTFKTGRKRNYIWWVPNCMPNSKVSSTAPAIQLKLDTKSTKAGAELVGSWDSERVSNLPQIRQEEGEDVEFKLILVEALKNISGCFPKWPRGTVITNTVQMMTPVRAVFIAAHICLCGCHISHGVLSILHSQTPFILTTLQDRCRQKFHCTGGRTAVQRGEGICPRPHSCYLIVGQIRLCWFLS